MACSKLHSLLLLIILVAACFGSCRALTCYVRAGSTSTTDNGTTTSCSTTCYSSSTQLQDAGCGSCTGRGPSCTTCSTDLCNTLVPSSISCFTRTASTSSGSNGTVTVCHTGISTCYAYWNSLIGSSGSDLSGCGNCASDSTECTASSMCNSNFCNPRLTSSISCYTRTSSSGGNGTATACSPGVTSCYGYWATSTILGGHVAGCGGCPSTSNDCTSSSVCTTNLCNIKPNPVNCYSTSGSIMHNQRSRTTCTDSSSCYEYSYNYGIINVFFAGCGSCSSFGTSRCRTCYTEYCNSAFRVASLSKITAVLMAVLVAVMKLF